MNAKIHGCVAATGIAGHFGPGEDKKIAVLAVYYDLETGKVAIIE
jgi:hypothetical protein